MARPLISDAMRARMGAQHVRNLYQTGDLWRMNAATGRRVEQETGVLLSIYPGGDVAISDDALGVTGRNSTFIGYVARDTDVRENDQFRNVRLADGTLWLDRYLADGSASTDGARFTVGTVEKWPTVIRLRISEEGA